MLIVKVRRICFPDKRLRRAWHGSVVVSDVPNLLWPVFVFLARAGVEPAAAYPSVSACVARDHALYHDPRDKYWTRFIS